MYVQRSIHTCLCNLCCSGKAISFKQLVCVHL